MTKHSVMKLVAFLFLNFLAIAGITQDTFKPLDVYDLEFAIDPQFSPDASKIVYARSFMDIMTDQRLSNLWIIDDLGSNHRALTTGTQRHTSPRWSPDGLKIAYLSNSSGKNQVEILWLDNGQSTQITNVQDAPYNITWSPDGKWLAFNMRKKKEQESFGKMPQKPKGADWADAPKYIDKLVYRADGRSFNKMYRSSSREYAGK